jgi:hypothetical protein
MVLPQYWHCTPSDGVSDSARIGEYIFPIAYKNLKGARNGYTIGGLPQNIGPHEDSSGNRQCEKGGQVVPAETLHPTEIHRAPPGSVPVCESVPLSRPDRRSRLDRRSPLNRRSSSDRVSTPLRRLSRERRSAGTRTWSLLIEAPRCLPLRYGGLCICHL